MTILQNISLQPYNTFNINVNTQYFTSVKNISELELALHFTEEKNINHLIIGGGSNILFTKNYDGLVIKNEFDGIEVINETDEHIFVKASAGVPWHSFVMYCIDYNYAGLENLSLIPGCVGASPMQNIGAYGAEIKDSFFELEAYHIEDKKVVKFNNNDCAFGYRESVFKNKFKNQFVILNVTFKLYKNPTFNTSYGAIEQELEKMNCTELSIKNISQAVINIRSSKLPNPKEIGNAGSFFKNPIITESLKNKLVEEFSTMPVYTATEGNYKVAAGWLIEQCSFKGFRNNDAGCHSKQALVLVNYGNAKGNEIFELSSNIINTVYQKFGIELEREVNIL